MIHKSEIRNPKSDVLKFVLCAYFGFCALTFDIKLAYAKEVVLLYTGETHAMLYTCSCPKEPDGGVARRQTLVKKMREEYPDLLLLDAGSFFAGGLLDEHTQNTELDTQRTLVNLKAMELMKYDAVAVGDNEFNFGKYFFLKQMKDRALTVLSCNMEPGPESGGLPYFIKEVNGIKIGLLGVTNTSANNKSGTLLFGDPKPYVARGVAELKKNGASLIVLLSQLQESEDFDLINEIEGIDILIASHHQAKDRIFSKIKDTLILKAFWQGRSLGKATLTVESGKLVDYKVEGFRLSDEIKDDPAIKAILPRCFSDADCKREGLIGRCQEPGNLPKARCLFDEPRKVGLTVISDKTCVTCQTEELVKFLKKTFPGLEQSTLYYPEQKAKDLLKELGLAGLPVYLFGKEVEAEKNFSSFKANLEVKGNYYLLKPQFAGFSTFLNRKKTPGTLDVFVSLYNKNARDLLDVIREFNPRIHFLATVDKDAFDAAQKEPEVQEYLRAMCVEKYNPKIFWDYISCRAKDFESSWWDDCLPGEGAQKIKACAQSEEGASLLKENIKLNKELGVLIGPTYLMDNQEIFSSDGVPRKEELKAIIKR
jgi:hypothetical protein